MNFLKPSKKKPDVQSTTPHHSSRPQDMLVEILLLFAKQHFRDPENVCPASVMFTKKPLSEPLLPHSDLALDRLALECFQALLVFTGDQPSAPNMEVHLIHMVLQMCRECQKPLELQQELYCQILKQMTYNKSLKRDSCFRCWQLLYFMALYYPCSGPLLSMVQLYLKTVVQCGSDTLITLAKGCYLQLRRSCRIGGRVYYPSPMEIKSLMVGRDRRWIFVNLPGASRQSLKVHMAMTVGDVTDKLCARLGITAKEHREEYGLTCGDCAEKLQSPVRSSLYIMDLLQELESLKGTNQVLWFYRMSWAEPLVLTSRLCVDMQYQQVVRLYETGQLLMRREHAPISQAELASRLAALKHRAAGACHPPNRCELKASIPADMWAAYDEDYWVRKVLLYLGQLLEKKVSASEAKMTYLDIASCFPLFGTTMLLLANIQPGDRHWQALDTRPSRPAMAPEKSWACLPEQVLVHIYSLLHLPDRFSMFLTCKAWSTVFRSPAMWRKVFIRVGGSSVRPWILLLSHYGHFIESVTVALKEDEEQRKMLTTSILEHLAYLRRSRLRGLTLVARESSGSYKEELQESLKLLFDVSPARSVGFTEINFTHLSGHLEDTVFICLATNNPSLEKLLIANTPPAIRLQPRTLIEILGSCRRLSHLAVWNSSITDEVALAFLQEQRAPLQWLRIHYENSTANTGIISSSVWKKLTERFPSLQAQFSFSEDVDAGLILDILQPGIPVISLDIRKASGLPKVLTHVAQNYHHCLKSLTVPGLDTPEAATAGLVLQKRCSQLKDIIYCETL